jgi:hypothetical protein
MSVSSAAFRTALYVPEPGSDRVFKLDLEPQVQPHLSLPTQGGQQIPVMLISPHDIAESGGECWFGPKHEYDPSAPTKGRGVDGHVRFAWHSSRHDPSVDPPCLSRKIPVSFDRGVMELPLCTPPPGASIVPVPLRRSPAALSAAASALDGELYDACSAVGGAEADARQKKVEDRKANAAVRWEDAQAARAEEGRGRRDGLQTQLLERRLRAFQSAVVRARAALAAEAGMGATLEHQVELCLPLGAAGDLTSIESA